MRKLLEKIKSFLRDYQLKTDKKGFIELANTIEQDYKEREELVLSNKLVSDLWREWPVDIDKKVFSAPELVYLGDCICCLN